MANHPVHPEIDLLAGEFYADVLAASKDTTTFSNARTATGPTVCRCR